MTRDAIDFMVGLAILALPTITARLVAMRRRSNEEFDKGTEAAWALLLGLAFMAVPTLLALVAAIRRDWHDVGFFSAVVLTFLALGITTGYDRDPTTVAAARVRWGLLIVGISAFTAAVAGLYGVGAFLSVLLVYCALVVNRRRRADRRVRGDRE
jgi:succinate-acetate transporter protein